MHIRADFRTGTLQVNVKDHNVWAHDPRTRDQIKELDQSVVNGIYEMTQEDFWHEANQIAIQFSYNMAFSTGRSGGWLETSAGPLFPCGIDYDSDNYKRFHEFAERIMKLKASYEQRFIEELTEEVNDLNKRRENAIVRSNN